MTPNATVSYMASQAERQLVEAKAARAWIVDEAVRNQAPGRGSSACPCGCLRCWRFASTGATNHEDTRTLPHTALGMADPAR